MRAFKEKVFDQMVRGSAAVYSPTERQELLGRADVLVFEVEVEEAGGTTPAISVSYMFSNSGKGFLTVSGGISSASLASLPYRSSFTTSGYALGALGQLSVTLANSDNTERVRIWACGRTA